MKKIIMPIVMLIILLSFSACQMGENAYVRPSSEYDNNSVMTNVKIVYPNGVSDMKRDESGMSFSYKGYSHTSKVLEEMQKQSGLFQNNITVSMAMEKLNDKELFAKYSKALDDNIISEDMYFGDAVAKMSGFSNAHDYLIFIGPIFDTMEKDPTFNIK